MQLFISGKFVDAHGGATMDNATMKPHATGKATTTVSAAQSADVDAAVQAARQAFDIGPWPRMTGKVHQSSAQQLHALACALLAVRFHL